MKLQPSLQKGTGLRILIQGSIVRYFTLPFNFTQVLLWHNVIKPYSLNSAGYNFALLRFLLHFAIQLWSQIGFDLISNCLFSVLWTWVSWFREEEKEHHGVGEKFSPLPWTSSHRVPSGSRLCYDSYITQTRIITEFQHVRTPWRADIL